MRTPTPAELGLCTGKMNVVERKAFGLIEQLRTVIGEGGRRGQIWKRYAEGLEETGQQRAVPLWASVRISCFSSDIILDLMSKTSGPLSEMKYAAVEFQNKTGIHKYVALDPASPLFQALHGKVTVQLGGLGRGEKRVVSGRVYIDAFRCEDAGSQLSQELDETDRDYDTFVVCALLMGEMDFL